MISLAVGRSSPTTSFFQGVLYILISCDCSFLFFSLYSLFFFDFLPYLIGSHSLKSFFLLRTFLIFIFFFLLLFLRIKAIELINKIFEFFIIFLVVMLYSNLFYLIDLFIMMDLVFFLDFLYWLLFFLKLLFWDLSFFLLLFFKVIVFLLAILHLCTHSFFLSPVAFELVILLKSDMSQSFNFMIDSDFNFDILKLRHWILVYFKPLLSQIARLLCFQIFHVAFFCHFIKVSVDALCISIEITFRIRMFHGYTLRKINYS